MGSFKLGEVGEYVPKFVSENDFLNGKLESDMYGIYYSVLFEGDAETYLMQAKKPPVEGQPEWGMIEESKSGKSLRFKRVKKEDGFTLKASISSTAVKDNAYLKDISNTPIMMYNGSLHYAKDLGLNLISNAEDRAVYLDYVKDITDEMILWIENIRGSDGARTPSTPTIKEAEAHPSKPATGYEQARQTAANLKGMVVSGENDYGDEPFEQ